MILNFSKKELKTLTELVYIGEKVVNGERLREDILPEYERVSDMILDAYMKSTERKWIKAYDELKEELRESSDHFFVEYELVEIIYTLARMKADELYGGSEQGLENLTARILYETELERKGLSIVHIDYPDIQSKVEASIRVEEEQFALYLEYKAKREADEIHKSNGDTDQ